MDNKSKMDMKELAKTVAVIMQTMRNEEKKETAKKEVKRKAEFVVTKSLWQLGDEGVANAFKKNEALLNDPTKTVEIYYGKNDAVSKGHIFSFSLGGIPYAFSIGQKTKVLKVHEDDVRAMISDSRYPKGEAITAHTVNDAFAGINVEMK